MIEPHVPATSVKMELAHGNKRVQMRAKRPKASDRHSAHPKSRSVFGVQTIGGVQNPHRQFGFILVDHDADFDLRG